MRNHSTADISDMMQFDAIIDVRSPAEFALDHLPGAINCPVLDDAERIEVGTLYKQVSPFAARKRGAQLVAKNIAQHLEQHFSGYEKEWRPLIYCWRGGMRSGSMTHVMRQVGWRAAQLQGGYQAFRRHVIAQLELISSQFHYIVLCGKTGSGKSRLLEVLHNMDAQVLDLEKLAEHRGSILGAIPNQSQPSQKHFETLLWQKLQSFDSRMPVFVEAESRKIGSVSLPESLANAMQNKGQLISVQAPLAARVKSLLADYQHFFAEPAALNTLLERLVVLRGRETIKQWQDLVDTGHWSTLVEQLLEQHYDPSYLRSAASRVGRHAAAETIELIDHDPQTIKIVAKQLLRSLGQVKP
jgi:tRNA 2-selenouridine synthase